MANKKEAVIPVKVEVEGEDKLEGLKKNLDEAKDSFEDLNKTGKKLPGVLGEVTEGIESITTGIGSATKAAISFIATPLGAILGAIALAIGAVTAAFKGSEEGQNKWAKIMGEISSILSGLEDILIKVGEYIISIFENPKKAITDFANLIKDNITNRLNGLLELIPALGEAINDLFHGKFTEAGKVAGNAVAKVTLGVDDLTGKINGAIDATGKWIDKQKENAQLAGDVADKRAKADKLDRKLKEETAKTEAKIAELRDKAADKEHRTAEQRKKDLKEAMELEEQMLNLETDAKKLRADAANEELKYLPKTKENLDKVVEANNAVVEVDKKRADGHRKLEKQLNNVDKEILENFKKSLESKEKALEKSDDAIIKAAQKGSKEELLAQQKKLDDQNAFLKKYGVQQGKSQEEINAEIQLNLAERKKLEDDFNDKELKEQTKQNEEYNAELAKSLRKKIELEISSEKELIKVLEEKQKKEELNAEEISALHDQRLKLIQSEYDAQVNAIDSASDLEINKINDSLMSEQAKADAIQKINQDATDQLIALSNQKTDKIIENNNKEADEYKKALDNELRMNESYADAVGSLSDTILQNEQANSKASKAAKLKAAKEEFEVNKAMQLVNTAINTIGNVIKDGGPETPKGILDIVNGAVAAAAIASKQFTGGETSGGGNPSFSSSSTSTFVPPSLQNVANNTGGNNPQTGQPVKAYVVSSDISKSSNASAMLQRRTSF